MVSQSRLGSVLGPNGFAICLPDTLGEVLAPFWGPFWRPKSIKIMIFRHRFLDAFLDCNFYGFWLVLDLIFEGFGRPNGIQNGKDLEKT